LFIWLWIKTVYWHISYDTIQVTWIKKPPKQMYLELKNECLKQKVKNAKHCIKTWLAINFAEASFRTKDLGLQSKDKSVKFWVKQYKKYWYTTKEWWRFYWYNKNKPAETRYCMSEYSSQSIWWCPNWRKNFNIIFFNIKI